MALVDSFDACGMETGHVLNRKCLSYVALSDHHILLKRIMLRLSKESKGVGCLPPLASFEPKPNLNQYITFLRILE